MICGRVVEQIFTVEERNKRLFWSAKELMNVEDAYRHIVMCKLATGVS